MAEITDRESLEVWVKTRPPADAILIAARSALRVLPTVHGLVENNIVHHRSAVLIRAFRGAAVANFVGVGSKTGSPALQVAAGHAAKFVVVHTNSAQAANAAAKAAEAAAYALRRDEQTIMKLHSAVVHSAIWAAEAADAADWPGGMWENISKDATTLESSLPQERRGIIPLWPGPLFGEAVFGLDRFGGAPSWARSPWLALKNHLLSVNEDWHVWTDWYDAIVEGRNQDPSFELAKALIPEEIWNQGPSVVNAEIARLIDQYQPTSHVVGGSIVGPALGQHLAPEAIEAETRPLALADFRYDKPAHTMRMVPFPEDVAALDSAARRDTVSEQLSVLRDLCLSLARDILLDKRQVPGSLRRDLNRYAREAALGLDDARPGWLRTLGNALLRAQQDREIGFGLGDYLHPKLDEIVRMHLRLEATVHAGMLNRMAPLSDAELLATPEETEAEIEAAIETMRSEEWRNLPRIPDEFPGMIEQQLEQLRAMTATIDLQPEGVERARLTRHREESYITLAATTARLVVRVLEWSGENRALSGAAVLTTLATGLMALIALV